MAGSTPSVGARASAERIPPPSPEAQPAQEDRRARGDGAEQVRTSAFAAALTAHPFANEGASFVAPTLERRVGEDLEGARWGQKTHRRYMDGVRGVSGIVSDWLQDVVPPHVEMWSHPQRHLERAQQALEAGDPARALREYELGAQLLGQAQAAWASYIDRTSEGAGRTAERFRYVRDASMVTVAALATGGAASAAMGGGAFAAAGGSGVGVAAGTDLARRRSTALGEDVRGTLAEAEQAELRHNLALARAGLVGMLHGTGAGIEATAEALHTLFTDPARIVQDLAALPGRLRALIENKDALLVAFRRLPPEAQSEMVGRFAGHIEALLITAATADAALAAAADTASGGGGVLQMRNLATPEGLRVALLEVATEVSVDARGAAATAWGKGAGAATADLTFSESVDERGGDESSTPPTEGEKALARLERKISDARTDASKRPSTRDIEQVRDQLLREGHASGELRTPARKKEQQNWLQAEGYAERLNRVRRGKMAVQEAERVGGGAEHTRHARGSTQGRHQEGQSQKAAREQRARHRRLEEN